MKQILLFAIIGLVGFIIDATATIFFAHQLFLEPIVAKLLAFPFAVTVTWLLNRSFTFVSKSTSLMLEWCSFVKVYMGGAIINHLTFYLAISFFELFKQNLLIAVALGSISGMFFNFLGSKFYVFK